MRTEFDGPYIRASAEKAGAFCLPAFRNSRYFLFYDPFHHPPYSYYLKLELNGIKNNLLCCNILAGFILIVIEYIMEIKGFII